MSQHTDKHNDENQNVPEEFENFHQMSPQQNEFERYDDEEEKGEPSSPYTEKSKNTGFTKEIDMLEQSSNTNDPELIP